jgi:transposase
MEVVFPNCCGLDIHKNTITACVLLSGGSRKQKHLQRFGTVTGELRSLAAWLHKFGVVQVAMESTGVYWKPIWNVLEGEFELCLVNAQHVKNVPGRKTDLKDCEWIAELLQHGLLRASFVPERSLRQLRDLNRYRASLIGERNRVANRIQKVLEDANIKLASVASDVLGQSGRSMLAAMIGGETSAEKLAEMARGQLRKKLPALQLALEGNIQEHHRFWLRQLLDHLNFLEGKIAELEQEIAARCHPYQEVIQRWDTIPGVDLITACSLVAEIGVRAEQFPSAHHLASWAGLCPGNDESAGKRRSGKTRKGDPWLRTVLCQAAWAASHTKRTYLSAQYHRIAAKRGRKRAIIAVAHSILVIAYILLRRGEVYRDLGGDYFERLDPVGLTRYLLRRLQKLGHTVTLQPQGSTV